jgi:RNase H-fold protein (predicted Holliday junction resolvase)
MPYRIAGIDVHEKMLGVAVAEVGVEGDVDFERKVGTSPVQLRALAEWLVEREVQELVLQSTRSIGDQSGRRWNGTGTDAPDAH